MNNKGLLKGVATFLIIILLIIVIYNYRSTVIEILNRLWSSIKR